MVVYVFRVPHSCQVGALLSALFHCHRPVAFTGATHALREAVHRKMCWLTCCVRKDRRLNTDLRFALVSELAHEFRPHVTLVP